ncbi:DUF2939 domain-containing protein [Limnohabitans sp. 2KL-27]|jgi:hypothetical protein|uniref:DUF2939 domain-containing protein n=1 Tax=Limnohabitans sp. 2KL-27 TaxID=1100705 RepID=UPI000B045EE2|nr:DUF2939 domain-containing protein [Limnohabitans sp. 2KL-27]
MKKIVSFSFAALIALALAVGAYWYYSPYLVINNMATAAKMKDADRFNEGVDYPRLRESLKGQISAQMAMTVGKQSSTPFGALGAMLGMAMVNQIVDSFVRPEMVMEMMKDGKVKTTGSSSSDSSETKEVNWVIERKGVDRVIAMAQDNRKSDSKAAVGFVFERSGFATWKVTELRMVFPN